MAIVPQYPTSFIPRPFAANGTFQIIPDAKPTSGRASWQEGFPMETQLPLSAGGIAPSRPDFNGILNILSALGFWQQSGGIFLYSQALNYNTPAVIFFNGELWWCDKQSGPESTAGVKIPGTDSDYWILFSEKLFGGQGGLPVGAFIHYCGTTAPNGFFACNGQPFSATDYPLLYNALGAAIVPDYRGLFLRSIGGNAAAQGAVRPASIGPHAHNVPKRVTPNTTQGIRRRIH